MIANRSETIGELAKALSLAQGQMTGAVKDSANPYFKNKYADLSSVWDACREPLSKNGLCITQTIAHGEKGFELTTTLFHLSGEWIASVHPVMPVKNEPQSIKSAITYARRFALAALVGVADVDAAIDDVGDDDGEDEARQREEMKPKEKPQPSIMIYRKIF
jgi:hypothetical protein